ncbi:MAG: DUF4136 domain-containing protein [Bacteroidota bacterium]
MRFFLALMALVLLTGCSSVRVDYDYEKSTDFSNYTTYNYFVDMETGLSPLDERRLLRILDSTLQARGFLLSEEPDFLVNIISQEYRNAPQNSVGVGVGGTNRNVGGGVSIGIPVGGSQLGRSIQFDLVDSQKNALYWQAISDSGFRSNASPLVREEQLRKVVEKVFSKFPPEVK